MVGADGDRATRMKHGVRLAAFLVGASFLAWLVVRAGPTHLYEAVVLAGPWFPAIVACELTIALGDLLAIRILVGQRLPIRAWLGSTAAAYASSLLLPAGRVAGEALRTTILAPYVGPSRAAGACSRMQACSLVANAIVSLGGTFFVIGPTLRVALFANAVVCGSIATVILLVVRSPRFAAFVAKRFRKLVDTHRGDGGASPGAGETFRASLAFVGARLVQVLQYGILVRAIAGRTTLSLAVSAHAIHLVGASVGDFVPGQLGVAEGSFQAFAASMGVDDVRALTLALVARASQVVAALVCAPLLFAYSKERLGADRELPAEAPVDDRERKVEAELGVDELGNEESNAGAETERARGLL